jgi:hypothetical protein
MSVNGRLTASELTAVYGGQLANATAAAWLAMVAAASRAGVSLVIAGGNSEGGSGAYRDYFVQGDMKVRPWLYGLSQYSTVSIAAAGYSTHGFGTAVDIGSFPPARNPRAYGDAGMSRRDWVLTHAAEFGFTRTFGEADPNHFGHNGTTRFLNSSSTAGTNQTSIPKEEDDMFSDEDRAMLRQAATRVNLPVLIKTADSPKVWLSNLVTRRLVADNAELGSIQRSLASRGLDSGVNTVESLAVFGVPVA